MKPGDTVKSASRDGTCLCSAPTSEGRWKRVGTLSRNELAFVVAFLGAATSDCCDCMVVTTTGKLGWVDWSLLEKVET